MKPSIDLAAFLPQEIIDKLKLQAHLEGRAFRKVLREFGRKLWKDIASSYKRVKKGRSHETI